MIRVAQGYRATALGTASQYGKPHLSVDSVRNSAPDFRSNMTTSSQLVRFSNLGENALLLDAAGETLSDVVQERIWDLSGALQHWTDIGEVVPGMNNLLVIFDCTRIDPADLEGKLLDAWLHTRRGAKTGRIIEIPVIYGGQTGIDLAHIADICGLAIETVVDLHASAEYTVYAVGSQPGFGYLAGLNERLAMPRRQVPRTKVEAGSVVIGGVQAGVISCTSPSGWHIIGRTEIRLFDPNRTPPVLLMPGDRIRFCVEGIKR